MKLIENQLRFSKEELEQRVERRTQELAEVQRGLMDAVETERLELSRELHDGTMQEIYGLIYSIAGVNQDSPPEELWQRLESIRTRLVAITRNLRDLSRDLRPPTLTAFGLEHSIREHLSRLRQNQPELKFQVELASAGLTLPEPIRLAFFRIYQVAITNVIRHAQASRVRVKFDINGGLAILEIEDDGVGFEPPENWIDLVRSDHLGLVGAWERAEAVGGQFEIQSQPGHGSLLRVRVPLDHPQG